MKEKNHVGRPTNEEVKRRKQKKILKGTLFIVLFLMVIIVGSKIINPNLLAGAAAKCPKGYVSCKSNKCQCKKPNPYDKATACASGYVAVNGKCWKSYNTSCPSGYKKCDNQSSCSCKATIQESKATACESGYSVVDGKCYKTTSGVTKCPSGYSECNDKTLCSCKKATPQKYGSEDDCKNAIQNSNEKTDALYKNGMCYRIKDNTKTCASGYTACTNGACECRAYSAEYKATSCASGYIAVDGKCYKTSAGIGKCPSGYEACKDKTKCDCKSKKSAAKATACESGYVAGSGKCWKTIGTTTTQKTCNEGQLKTENGGCKNIITKCKSGYAPISGTCKAISKFTDGKSKCPKDYKICLNQNKCNCYNVKRHSGLALACIEGYTVVSGNCVKNSVAKKEALKSSSSNGYTKILLIGNSYTYYNGYGQMLAKLAGKTGKKVIVVRATHGGYSALDLYETNAISYVAWSSTDGTLGSGSGKKLKDVINMDFGKLKRTDWDYVVLQNNQDVKHSGKYTDAQLKTIESKIIEGDTKIYNLVKSKIPSSKNFIINATHFHKSVSNRRYNMHKKMASKYNCSIINSAKLYEEYTNMYKRNWIGELTVCDDPNHQSGRGGYIYALAIYARIFGVNEFASSQTDNNFIALYNKDGGTTSEFAPNYFKKKNGNSHSYSVDIKTAKKLQYLVRKYYKKYVLAY